MCLLWWLLRAGFSMEGAVFGSEEPVIASDGDSETWYYIASTASGSASHCTGSVIYVTKD